MAIERLQEAARYLIEEDKEKSAGAVSEVLAGRLPKALFEEKRILNVSRKRKHEGVSPYLPKNIVSVRKTLACTLDELVTECLDKEITDNCWKKLLSNDLKNVFATVKKESPQNKQNFLKKFEEAKCVWICALCDSIEPRLAYVYCKFCSSTYHRDCIGIELSSDKWVCNDCQGFE